MAYQQIGFDEFLNRTNEDTSGQVGEALDPSEIDNYFSEIPGSKIQGGLITSPDGILQLDLENSVLRINNGVTDLINFGRLPDGSIGLFIRDQNENILMQVSSSGVFIQGPGKHLKVDMTNEQITVKDENNVPVGAIGLLQEVT